MGKRMKLVIVESPTKSHTIASYLGKDYEVVATKGHIRDLAKEGRGGLGVDVYHDFKPKYVVTNFSSVNELVKKSKDASEIILATDPDREGEAIAWHVTQVLKINPLTTKRMEFHEITRSSITEAIKNPRTIDLNLVSSQETRRIIDRIIGFDLSGLLQRRIKQKSAGRVQSATLKLVCDHENKIKEFVPEEYWTYLIKLNIDNEIISVPLYQINGEKYHIANETEANQIKARNGDSVFVKTIKTSTHRIESKPSFTTSTLQQEAFNVYRFSTKQTSSLAQKLFEGVKIGGELVGLITYIRTDSTALSDTYVARAKNYIVETYGDEYFSGKKSAKKEFLSQGAHEAIRPTSNHRTPESVKQYLLALGSDGEKLYKLYKLIYNRALASLMSAKKESVTTIIFGADNLTFKLEVPVLTFDGYTILSGEKQERALNISFLHEGDKMPISEIVCEKKFTEPPERYSEAKLVKLMEEKGIGRPSTYSSTINHLYHHRYLEQEKGILRPTEEGMKNAFILNKYFPNLVNAKYTAELEAELDEIQEGKENRSSILHKFYDAFIEQYNSVKEKMYKDDDQETGELCPLCGKPLVIKKSVKGTFIGCSNYPKCKYHSTDNYEKVGENCPKCGQPLVYRYDKNNKKFISCSAYPNCSYSRNIYQAPAPILYRARKCPKCGGDLLLKKGKYGSYLECSNFAKCGFRERYKKSSRK